MPLPKAAAPEPPAEAAVFGKPPREGAPKQFSRFGRVCRRVWQTRPASLKRRSRHGVLLFLRWLLLLAQTELREEFVLDIRLWSEGDPGPATLPAQAYG